MAEYGVDMPGQLLVSLSIILISIILFNNFSDELKIRYYYLSLYLIIFAVTTKLIYSIYFIIPIIMGLKLFGVRKLCSLLIEYKFLFLSIFSALVFIFYNFTYSGCFIYPVEKTCFFYELEWTLSEETILHLNLHYEAWAKGGIGAGYKLDDIENYVNSFNWFENWFRNYFFTKFSDYILVILIVSLIFYLISSKKKVTKLFSKNKN